jgi:predicted nucleic acid-binding protein
VTATTASDAVVVDSSGWLEYLTNDSKADAFSPYLEGNLVVLVPTIIIFEVRKILSLRQNRSLSDIFYSQVLRRMIVSFDEVLALKSANVSIEHKLSMADSIIYATARHFEAQLVTSDPHFANLPKVTII